VKHVVVTSTYTENEAIPLVEILVLVMLDGKVDGL